MYALQLKTEERKPDKYEVKEDLDTISENYPTFNRTVALKKLESLNVLSHENISMLMGILSDYTEE